MGRLPWASEVFRQPQRSRHRQHGIAALVCQPRAKRALVAPVAPWGNSPRPLRCCSSRTWPPPIPPTCKPVCATRETNWSSCGRKWRVSGAVHPACKLLIVMARSGDDEAAPHARHSMVLVPMNTPGVTVVRNIPIMQHHSPEGHCEIVFLNVRVPAANLLGQEGAGFAMAQARLGPGRVHHPHGAPLASASWRSR